MDCLYLIDYRFRVMHFDPERRVFYATSIHNIDTEQVLRFDRPGDFERLSDTFIFRENFSAEWPMEIEGLGRVQICYDPVAPRLALRGENGLYLCADATGDYEFSRDRVQMWECFWVLSEETRVQLEYILTHSWISTRTGEVYRPDRVVLDENFTLRIGVFQLDFRLQEASDFTTYEIHGIIDGWVPETFLLYRPLVYVTAYSSPAVLAQLQIFVRSLRDIGRYDGPIIVMTDQTVEKINAICEEAPGTIGVDTMFPTDFVGYVCSKYKIFDKEQYQGFQPVVYFDPDIVIDNPIEPMLLAGTLTRRVCAPMETFHRLQSHPPVGATLLQLDQIDPGPFAAGVNGGTIMFPNIEDAGTRRAFDRIERTLTYVGMRFGRTWSGWADQEAFNYIMVKMGDINSTALTRYARFSTLPGPLECRRVGFLHFWGYSSAEKVERMRAYLADLYREDGIGRALPEWAP